MRTDKEMLALLKSDPETGMACLIDAFAPVVWAAAARVLPQPEDVRECVNDTFTEFYFKQDAFDPGKGTLKSWLALLARRRAIDRLRAAKAGGEAQPLDESLPAPSGLTPEDRLALQEALARLSPEEAELIRLQYFEGYTPKEIADRLGLPYETVKKRRQRALARLRKSLLATLILVLLALLAACGYAVLRYFGILPGVRRQHRRRNAVLYPGRGSGRRKRPGRGGDHRRRARGRAAFGADRADPRAGRGRQPDRQRRTGLDRPLAPYADDHVRAQAARDLGRRRSGVHRLLLDPGRPGDGRQRAGNAGRRCLRDPVLLRGGRPARRRAR